MTAEDVARAWDEGCRAAEQYYQRTVLGRSGLGPVEAPLNPYRPLSAKGDRNLSPAEVDDYSALLEARVAEFAAGMRKATDQMKPAAERALRGATEALRLK